MKETPVAEFWLRRAIARAVDNVAQGGGPFGAVIVRGGELIAEGVNRVTADCDPTAHAEVVAIRCAAQSLRNFDLSGCDLYASCEPCPMCLGAILWARIDRIYYAASRHDAAAAGFDDAAFYEEFERAASHRLVCVQPVAIDNAADPFHAWRQLTDRKEY